MPFTLSRRPETPRRVQGMATLDRELSSTELRDDITTVVSSVEHGHARIGVTRHGKLAAVVIGVEDLESRVA
jgi:prevent-host-death family protein